MRQQLVWVVGSLIPLIIVFTLPQGDATMAVLAALGGLSYVTGRRAARAPRMVQRDYRNLGDVGEAGRSGRPDAPGLQPRRCPSVSAWSASAWGSRSPNLA